MTPGIADARLSVDDAKLTGYLLSSATEKSRSRLKFLASFGFDPASPDVLCAALLAHWTTGTILVRPASTFGKHCNVHGRLSSPDGRHPVVTTAWTKLHGENVWRFTTLLPK